MIIPDKIEVGVALLRELSSKLGVTSYLAGGAVRDWIHDKEINDLDVYVTHTGKWEFKDAVKYYPLFSNTPYLLSNKYSNWSIIKGEYKGVDTELILCKDPVDVIQHFDLGICRCWLNKEGELINTEAFDKDMENSTITLYPDDITGSQLIRSTSYHIPKLIQKYPEHELRIGYEQDKIVF